MPGIVALQRVMGDKWTTTKASHGGQMDESTTKQNDTNWSNGHQVEQVYLHEQVMEVLQVDHHCKQWSELPR